MDPEAQRRACVEFRAKLSRDTEVNLTAAACEQLLGGTFVPDSGEAPVTLESDPGLFYLSVGATIAFQTLALDIPNRMKVAWWCFREAAEVYAHPGGITLPCHHAICRKCKSKWLRINPTCPFCRAFVPKMYNSEYFDLYL
jgi:hypothetical protein